VALPTGTLSIRNETRVDLSGIRALTQEAFGRDAEADLIDRLRADDDLVASLIALHAGDVIGHILFSRLAIERDGDVVAAAALGPMAVAPANQRSGIGSLLIMRGLEMLPRRGIRAVVVVGHPSYYPRFGFRPELAAALESPYSGAADAHMALELDPGCLTGGGRVRYPAAFADLE
jgi:putative acetyltransferase